MTISRRKANKILGTISVCCLQNDLISALTLEEAHKEDAHV